jgi:hypothetical protein
MFKLLTDVRIKLLKNNKIVSHIINTTQTKKNKFKNIKEGITFNHTNKEKFSVPY